MTATLKDVITFIPSRGRLQSLVNCWTKLLIHNNIHPDRKVFILASKDYQILYRWKQARFIFVQTEHWTQGMAYAACVDYAEPWDWKYLLIVEDDSTCRAGVVQSMVDAMEEFPQIGMCTPMPPIGGHYPGEIHDVQKSYGHLLLRREAIRKAGNFLHDMPSRAEAELGIRLRLANFLFSGIVFDQGIGHKKMVIGGVADHLKKICEPASFGRMAKKIAGKVIQDHYRGPNRFVKVHRNTGAICIDKELVQKYVDTGAATEFLSYQNYRYSKRLGYTLEELAQAPIL